MKTNLTSKSKKVFLALVFFLGVSIFSFGQIPSFYNYNAGNAGYSFPLNNTSINKMQWIYAPSVFNSMGTLGGTPAFLGVIDTVYFRAGSSANPSFTDFTVSMAQNVGTQSTWANGIFNLGMTQVFQSSPHILTTQSGNWWAVALQTPFLYDPSLSLVVELKQNGISGNGPLTRMNTTNGITRIWGGFANPTGSSGSGQADFGFDLVPPVPCNSFTLSTGVLSPNNPTVCSGQSLNFSAPNASLGSGITFQWQSSPNGVVWTNIAGATNLNYQTPPLFVTTHYRLIMNCTLNSVSDTSAPSIVTVSPPTFATLPYAQDFENWASYCNVSEVPDDYHWENIQGNGNNSWRREDQGSTATWINPASGLYFPSASSGNHSARFHSYSTSLSGNLDLYVDCSGSAGAKTLSFDYINDNSTSGSDNILISYSTNGGTFFLPAAQYGSSVNWQSLFVSINSSSPNTIIRFTASGGSNSVPGSDIGIDNIKVLSPCTGAPVAGTIDSTTACPNKPLILNISGGTLQGGVTYAWDTASIATGPWGLIGTSAGPTFSTTITAPKYFRCRMTCVSTTLSDTTAVRYIDVLPFYICYCDNAATVLQFENIGNVNLRDKIGSTPIINNGAFTSNLNEPTAVNPYSLFQFNPAPIIYSDSAYYIDVTGVSFVNSFNNSWAKVYIDFNRDGVYNVTNEVVANGPVRMNTNYMRVDSFVVPSLTNYGLTGMRVILQEGGNQNTVLPCGAYGRGEVEDYVINLQLLPCNTPPNAGLSIIDDTSTCTGNTIRIINTTHDRFFANLSFSWQESTDGITFNDIVGGAVDTMFRTINQTMWYRYRATCNGTSDAFSNVVKVTVLGSPPCLTQSYATGPGDRSDIGAIVISEPPPTNTNLYTFSSGGPHLNNPASYKLYTNHTAAGPLDLFTGSIYKFSVYHILNTSIHSDAQVSIFIDYNGDQTFDPSERVFNGFSNAANFFLNATVGIPPSAVTNTPVIMRVVLNDDLTANGPSTSGTGNFLSGETEDFYLRFNEPISTKNLDDKIQNVGIYPNPTPDELNVDFTTLESVNVDIDILSVTGSILRTKNLGKVYGDKHVTFDLKDLSSGIYMMRFTAGDTKFVRRLTIQK